MLEEPASTFCTKMFLSYRYFSAQSTKKRDIFVVSCVQDSLMHLLKSSKVLLLRHFKIPEDVCCKKNYNEDEMNLSHVSMIDYRGEVSLVGSFCRTHPHHEASSSTFPRWTVFARNCPSPIPWHVCACNQVPDSRFHAFAYAFAQTTALYVV